jgi:hypothetical protein
MHFYSGEQGETDDCCIVGTPDRTSKTHRFFTHKACKIITPQFAASYTGGVLSICLPVFFSPRTLRIRYLNRSASSGREVALPAGRRTATSETERHCLYKPVSVPGFFLVFSIPILVQPISVFRIEFLVGTAAMTDHSPQQKCDCAFKCMSSDFGSDPPQHFTMYLIIVLYPTIFLPWQTQKASSQPFRR